MAREIYALGIGHNTPVFIDLALSCGYEVTGLYHYNDERTGETDHGYPILGSFADLFVQDIREKMFLLTMGDSHIKAELTQHILEGGGSVPSLIHPSAVISAFAHIHPIGVYISPFSYVQADSSIGLGSVLLSHVNVSHTTSIGQYCFIAGGSHIGAYTDVEDFVFVGQGVLSISAKVKKIGHGAFIGAGSLLTHEVPAGAKVMGRPAKIIE
jgi:UDP-perosamine 4-acetyltransferase